MPAIKVLKVTDSKEWKDRAVGYAKREYEAVCSSCGKTFKDFIHCDPVYWEEYKNSNLYCPKCD